VTWASNYNSLNRGGGRFLIPLRLIIFSLVAHLLIVKALVAPLYLRLLRLRFRTIRLRPN
jgi:hypothetical protein